MAFDFNPDLSIEEGTKTAKIKSKKEDQVITQEGALVASNQNSDVVTMNNLLSLTQSHINDDVKCREVIEDLTDELNNSIHLMSIKEIIEYLKVKLREREFHVDCIFKAYTFIQRSEYAREMFIGSRRKERIIEASDRKDIRELLDMLNSTEEDE